MWTIPGNPTAADRFEPFEPEAILYAFDGPRIFTLRDNERELYLAYWSDGDDSIDRYVVVPTSEAILTALKSGRISVREALDQPRCWLCDVTYNGQLQECRRVNFSDIPNDCLPAVGTMLLPELEPLLTLRAIGDAIVPGQIPSSVLRACIEGVQKCFKYLSEFALGRLSQLGRPNEVLRRLFDLPTQELAFGSLVISFRMPIEEKDLFTATGQKSPEAETLEEVGRLLDKGLRWLMSDAGEVGIYPPEATEEGDVLLRALKELTPSTQGYIDQLELSGRLLGSRPKPFTLGREARQTVNAAIRYRQLEPKIVKLRGRIRELDKDRMSFELRDMPEGPYSQRFVFEEHLRDDVFEAFQSEAVVTVVGVTFPVKNIMFATVISSSDDTPPVAATTGD